MEKLVSRWVTMQSNSPKPLAQIILTSQPHRKPRSCGTWKTICKWSLAAQRLGLGTAGRSIWSSNYSDATKLMTSVEPGNRNSPYKPQEMQIGPSCKPQGVEPRACSNCHRLLKKKIKIYHDAFRLTSAAPFISCLINRWMPLQYMQHRQSAMVQP